MTDNEIIKALECCVKTEFISDCAKCEMFAFDCKDILIENALDLINRIQDEKQTLINGQETLQNTIVEQKAEIESLKHRKTELQIRNQELQHEKSKAIKEFAERLKEKAERLHPNKWVIGIDVIDNLVKEMAGDADV